MVKSISFYKSLKNNLESVRSGYIKLWSLIASVLGHNTLYSNRLGESGIGESDVLDTNAYDPSSRRAVETVCDFYASLVFPSKNPFSLVPPDNIKDVRQSDQDWFDEQTRRLIRALHSPKSGFLEVKNMFYRDWETYGTTAFFVTESNDPDCPFVVQQFGVDNMAIQDGGNSQPEYAVLAFNWYPQVIVDYFGGSKGEYYKRLPSEIRKAFESGEWDTKYKLYCIIHKNDEFDSNAKIGPRTAQFVGAWIFDNDDKIFAKNEYYENPLIVSRYARIRGEVYGRSDIGNFINTVAAINGILYLAYQALGKTADPAIGIYDNAIAQDTEIDTDAGAILALDSTFASANNPIVPLQDIGNAEPLTKFLLTFLADELTKAFKLDVIMPIIQTNGMTATEFVNRLAMQGEVLSGVLMRHLSQISGFYTRITNIAARTKGFFDLRNAPEFVKEAIREGKAWYDIKHNNAVTNILNASKQRDFVNTLNSIIMAAQIDQSIAPDLDLYDSVLEIVRDSVLKNVLPTKMEHEQRKAARAREAAVAQEAQIANIASQANRNNAQAATMKPQI